VNRAVIVGASLAGVTAADALRAEGYDGQIAMVGDERHPPYTRPPLSKGVLAGAETPESVQLPALGDDVELRLSAPAKALDLRASEVVLNGDQRLAFDGLIVATGARARSLARPGQLGEVVLRTLDDALSVRAKLASGPDVLIIGAGFLGMEIASTCRALGLDVTLVDREPPLRRVLGEYLARLLTEAALDAGVRVQVSHGNAELLGTDHIQGVRLADGRELHADVVITAAGDVPNTGWLADSGLPVAGGLVVDDRCRALPNVVAAGDVVAIATYLQGATIRTPHWASAIEQARVAAAALLHGEAATPLRSTPYYWTEQFELEVKVSGALPVHGEPALLEGSVADRNAVLQWRDEHGVPYAAATINRRMPIAKLKRLARPEPAHTPSHESRRSSGHAATNPAPIRSIQP
jgi:NADPH-dependent 2,4-dienoyl-CoA reductase/sulfur reductase-like enzyme